MYKNVRKRNLKGEFKRWKAKYDFRGFLYVLPWLIGFLVFQLYPLVASFIYSFTNYDILNPPEYVGFSNYAELFRSDPYFWDSVKATFLYVFLSVPLRLIFALAVAMILAQKLRGINFFRTMYYLPSILGGSVAIAIVWRFIFMGDGGLLNNLLDNYLGIKGINWLGSPKYAIYTLIILSVWQFGSSMVIFLAALKQVPIEQYEGARVEGASKWFVFWKITLPNISPIILFNLVMTLNSAFQDFTGAFVVTKGGPMKSTYFVSLKLYNDAFVYRRMGYASALSWLLFAVIIMLTLFIFRTSRHWVFYSDGKDEII